MQMRLFLCFFNHCIFVDFYFIFRVFWVFFVFLTVSGKFSGMTVGLNYTGEVKQAAMGLFLPFVLSHIFLTFLCVLLSIFKKFGINNDFVICRCTCWPRQPSQLSGCHWGRHGSVYRILGQLPQDLELKLKQQDPTLKIHLTKLLSSWQQQNHNQSFWKLLKIKRLNDNEQKNGFVPIFFKFYFWPYLGFAFQCSRSVMMSAKSKKAKKLDLLS